MLILPDKYFKSFFQWLHLTRQFASVTSCEHGDVLIFGEVTVLQCFDTVGWAAGRASGL